MKLLEWQWLVTVESLLEERRKAGAEACWQGLGSLTFLPLSRRTDFPIQGDTEPRIKTWLQSFNRYRCCTRGIETENPLRG